MFSKEVKERRNEWSKRMVAALLVLILVAGTLMFSSCGNNDESVLEVSNTSEVKQPKAESSAVVNDINIRLENVYAGVTGVGNLVERIETISANGEKNYELKVTGVDTSNFPQVSIYYSLYNEFGTLITDTTRNRIAIVEQMDLDNTKAMQMISDIKPVKGNEQSNASIIMDLSCSMLVDDNIDYLKASVAQFVEGINMNDQRQVSLIGFSEEIVSYVEFTDNENTIVKEVESYEAIGRTALYDSIYWALTQTNAQSGQKFVIAFTDGMDNSSQFSAEDIVEASKELGIPVHVIALGESIDSASLQLIASESNGQYFNLSSISDAYSIYNDIFNGHMEESVVTYTTTNTDIDDFWRTLELYYLSDEGMASSYAQYNPVKSFIEDNSNIQLDDLGKNIVNTAVDYNDYIGVWDGYYFNNSGTMDMILEITDVTKDGKVTAVFSFTPSDQPNDPNRTGAFIMEGYIEKSTDIVYLEGKDWLTKAPKGYNTLDIYGEIFDNTFNGSFYRDYKPNFYLARK